MAKQLKDYLHFYLGCEVMVRKRERDKSWLKGKISEVSRNSNHGDWIEVNFGEIVKIHTETWDESTSNFHNYFIGYDEIKPILRKVESISDDEIKELIGWDKLNELYVGISFKKDRNSIIINYSIDAEGEGVYPQTHVISFSCFSPSEFHYLLSKSFDLFGLIEENLAIDQNTINK